MPQTVVFVLRVVVFLLIMSRTARLIAQTTVQQQAAFSFNTAPVKKIYAKDEGSRYALKDRLV